MNQDHAAGNRIEGVVDFGMGADGPIDGLGDSPVDRGGLLVVALF